MGEHMPKWKLDSLQMKSCMINANQDDSFYRNWAKKAMCQASQYEHCLTALDLCAMYL